MRALALDPETGDLRLTGGRIALVEGLDAVAQRLKGRLGLGQGEWFADLSLGVPWVQSILGQKGGERVAEAILRGAVASCPGVATVPSFAFAFDASTRHATVVFRVRTTDGETLAATSGPDGFRWERA